MPTRAPTPCPVCSTLGACPHRGQARRTRSSRTWTTTSADTIAAHVAIHGWTCPGWPDTHHAPHPSTDLTVHHVDQLHSSGHDTGRHAVLCRSENSAIG